MSIAYNKVQNQVTILNTDDNQVLYGNKMFELMDQPYSMRIDYTYYITHYTLLYLVYILTNIIINYIRHLYLLHNWRLRTGRTFQNVFKNNIIHTLIVILLELLSFIIDIKRDTDTTFLFSIIRILILGVKLNNNCTYCTFKQREKSLLSHRLKLMSYKLSKCLAKRELPTLRLTIVVSALLAITFFTVPYIIFYHVLNTRDRY
ncbi:hypothetical protein AGLY_004617 [Aphis glycines]|uniref:Uncharacterized protein n=1 Tax=Aphis glycines TaxID=307491 RepID=A0A6G0TUD2_APHGL|nr:hypothetical protein AGLY_004617 [Aphis glycines]